MVKNRKKLGRLNGSDLIFQTLIFIIAILGFSITAFPFLHVFSSSISGISALVQNKVTIFPVDIDFTSYKEVLKTNEVWSAYYNTIWYTVVGTAISIAITTMAAYPLSRKSFIGRRRVTLFFAFTMYFNGGLIPFYLTVVNLNLYNTRWAMVLPTVLSVYNLIICRTAFEQIPNEVFESCKIDGASEFLIFSKIVLPLQKGTIAVIVLYYAVANWNAFFNALLFLSSKDLQPLQILLRRIVIQSSPELLMKMGAENLQNDSDRFMLSAQMKYAVVMVSIGPILLIYPFIQKYLVKGVMIGAIKG